MTNKSLIYYMEDGKIPVCTIYVLIYKEDVTESDLRDYFENFGQVRNVKIEVKYYLNVHDAFITYERAEHAANVINIKRHTMNGVTLEVMFAASWQQPYFIETQFNQPKVDFIISNSISPENSILTLNDDCLQHIFEFCNLPDKVKLSELCSRLNEIAKMIFRTMKKVNLKKIVICGITEAQNILRKLEKTVEHISYKGFNSTTSYSKNCAEFFPLHCTNLKILEFQDIDTHFIRINSWTSVFKKLKSITLENCGLYDRTLANFKNCLQLEYLDISNNSKLNGTTFTNLPNTIKTLKLNACINIRKVYFLNLCKVARFENLEICLSFQLRGRALKELSKMECLKYIAFSTHQDALAEDYWPIAKVPNLKQLKFHGDTDNHFFEILATEKSDKIETLFLHNIYLNDFKRAIFYNFTNLRRIMIQNGADDYFLTVLANRNVELRCLCISKNDHITDDGILHFVEKSKYIRGIGLSECKQVSAKFILKLIKKLEELKRETVVEVTVRNIEFYELPDKNFKHLIQISTN